MSEPKIRVLIADDHVLVRKGLRALLAREPDICVIGEASDGRAAIAAAAQLQPDVILMDLSMPELDGIEATRAISARQPEIRILVLTSFTTDDKVFPALKAGARGYLLKDSEPEALTQALRQVYRGESSLHPAIARKVLQELTSPTPPPAAPAAEPLTEREIEVLRLIAQGFSNKEIAARLVITEKTARTHVSNILHKLQLASRTQATLYALREGLVTLEGDDKPEEP